MLGKFKIDFAPIQGSTDAFYRQLHNSIFGGINCYYAPFARIEKGEMRKKDVADLLPQNNIDINIIPQLIVKNNDEFRFLTSKIRSMGYRRIDLNMGCPFPMQTSRGRGVGLIGNRDEFQQICETIKNDTDVKYSLKMRLGLNSDSEFIGVLGIINSTPFCHVTLHPRTGAQQYRGSVNIPMFEKFLTQCQHPVIYNGDILYVEDIYKFEKNYPELSGLMIGRGLLANPSLAADYINDVTKTNFNDYIPKLETMHKKLYNHYVSIFQGETQILLKMKYFWSYFEISLLGHKFFKQIKKSTSLRNYNSTINAIFKNIKKEHCL